MTRVEPTVVYDRDGDTWARAGGGGGYTLDGGNGRRSGLRDLVEKYGPLTLPPNADGLVSFVVLTAAPLDDLEPDAWTVIAEAVDQALATWTLPAAV